MKLQALSQLRPVPTRAIVINVGTEIVSSVAIASALRHAGVPLLVVNCTAHGLSKVFFDELHAQWNFDLIDLPLTIHGAMLDRLIAEVPADHLLLVDSDAELLSPEPVKRMHYAMQDERAYGSGFLQQSGWLSGQQTNLEAGGNEIPAIYAERPWIPLALLRTSYVRAALNNGASMRERFFAGPSRDVVIAPELMQRVQPAIVQADTGGEVHGWMSASGMYYEGPDVSEAAGLVNHHHGVSRWMIRPDDQNATALDHAEQTALNAMSTSYRDRWDGFAHAIELAKQVPQ